MVANLKNMISQVFYTPVQTVQPTSVNPFAVNTFPTSQGEQKNEKYGKNTPIPGGYFAGYYNNKPNIVGQRLFVLV